MEQKDLVVKKSQIEEGVLVKHPTKPEWGLGKVLVMQGESATIFFKDDPTDHRTILLNLVELTVADEQSDPMLDRLPPFIDGAFVTKAKKVTHQEGVDAFKRWYPGGFTDPQYLGGGRATIMSVNATIKCAPIRDTWTPSVAAGAKHS